MSDADTRARMWRASRSAHRVLSGERPATMREQLEALASSGIDLDRRGDVYLDGIVGELEARVAAMLGAEGALWMPTGTMAQQVALRCWAARADSRRVALHPLQHQLVHEEDAVTALSALEPVLATPEPRYPTPAELRAAAEGAAAAVLEVPMQELGYALPAWPEFEALCAAVRDAGAAVHLDGARIWEAAAGWERGAREVAALADSVYVSMYKGVGGSAGALLLGDEALLEEARVWRTRYGGLVFSAWPAVASALAGMDRLDRVPAWTSRARIVTDALRAQGGFVPERPRTRECFVRSSLPAAALDRAVLEVLEETGWRFLHGWWADGDGALAELTVGDDALEWSGEDVARVAAQVAERARAMAARPPLDE